MAITVILAGLIGAIFLVDQAERQRPALQPVRAKSNESRKPKARS